jgi:hypothetical protein
MSLILDTGALLAVERVDRDTIALIKRDLLERRAPMTHGGVIGQAWRGAAGRQANLARLLPALDVASLDAELVRRSGVLLARTRTTDVIAAALVLIAADGDVLLTSEPHDLQVLASAADVHVDIVPI